MVRPPHIRRVEHPDHLQRDKPALCRGPAATPGPAFWVSTRAPTRPAPGSPAGTSDAWPALAESPTHGCAGTNIRLGSEMPMTFPREACWVRSPNPDRDRNYPRLPTPLTLSADMPWR